MRRSGHLVIGVSAVLAMAGCGSDAKKASLSPACTASVASILQALQTAPKAVLLSDGTTISKCMSGGTGDADLQNVGTVFFNVADQLGDRARLNDTKAAIQLGYLIGAVSRGAAKTNGVMAELVRRIGLVGGRLEAAKPAQGAHVELGRGAGETFG